MTESEWRSEIGTNHGQNVLGVRKMTKSEQKAFRLGATGSNSFTLAHANSRQLDSESGLSKISEFTPARKELKIDNMSLNSEMVNNIPSARKIFDPNQNISLRTGPMMPPHAFDIYSDVSNSRKIKTQFDGTLGNSSTNFASKVLGLKQSAGKSSAR